ncbi:DNA polymerase III subunit beta [Hymenobacter metallilatus]|uniref:Beta sliding clamp n=1 Tax=Hymenobacter metallilatus TaxID=2493666 RepID=A0A428JD42_9BACT|nr:DNA polymerase III subunit beta [Hymenobacter metallilatus]RSK29876.1 DNA polymerase III subunit beta [Hymenobacter metallilatus]
MNASALATSAVSLVINSANLLKAAQYASLLVTRNPVVPVLENLLLEVEPTKTKYSTARSLRLISSDLEHRFTSRSIPIEATVYPEGASICVPGRQLTDLLRNISEQPVTLEIEEDGGHPYLLLKAELALSLLPSGKGAATYELAGEAGGEFPRNTVLALPTTTLHIPGHLLLEGLALTLPVTGTDELRPAMTGILLEVSAQQFQLVATDGHRLVRFTKQDQHSLQGIERRCIIPRKAAELLHKLVDRRERLEMQLLNDNIRVVMEKGELLIRLIDERYPDYENVIPEFQPNVLTAHRLELLAGVKRAALFANKTTHQIALHLRGDGCELVAEDLDFDNRARESVSGSYQGESMAIGFSYRFLQGFLQLLPCQNVKMSMSTPSRAIVLQSADANDGVLCLLMPVMLNNYI